MQKLSRKTAAYQRLIQLMLCLLLFMSAEKSAHFLISFPMNKAAEGVSPFRLQPQQSLHLSTLDVSLFLLLETRHKIVLNKIHTLVLSAVNKQTDQSLTGTRAGGFKLEVQEPILSLFSPETSQHSHATSHGPLSLRNFSRRELQQ